MGQTLTNGIYLPAEGERNCYEGLAANWTALDGMIGGYNVHISNTTIHVTAEDKEAWNGKQDALSQTQLDAVNSGIDSSKVQQIATNTSDISSLQSGKANDNSVVHTSGNETVGGNKIFSNDIIRGSANTNSTIQARSFIGNTTASTAGSNSSAYQSITATLNYSDGTPSKSTTVSLYVTENAYADGRYSSFRPGSNNATNLGISGKRWANVYATNYYYGSSEVEFSTKFVTTDTAQTITESKTFTKNVKIKNTDVTRGTTTGSGTKNITYTDSNDDELSSISVSKNSNGSTSLVFKTSSTDNTDALISSSFQFFINKNGNKVINPTTSEDIALGRNSNKWSDVVTTKVNGLTPSSLSLPSDRSIDISGYITDLTGGNNQYTAPDNGIVAVDISGTNSYVLYNDKLSIGDRLTGSNFRRAGIIPVRKNDLVIIQSDGGTLNYAKFYPCQGNV